MGDKPHLHGNLAGRRAGVGADEEETPTGRQPFVIHASEDGDRIVEVLEDVRHHDVVETAWQSYLLEPVVMEGDAVTETGSSLRDRRAGTLHAGAGVG